MIEVDLTNRHLCLSWDAMRPALSSAVLNGGFRQVARVLNLHVNGEESQDDPCDTLQNYIASQGWTGESIGLMTAASMDSVRSAAASMDSGRVEVWLSSGLANARRAGDPADWVPHQRLPLGTINIVLVTSMALAPAAMAELLMIVTEAKCAVLQDLRIPSAVSKGTATGTGTDSTVIVGGAPGSGSPVRWAGKHTLLGQVAARITMQALRESIGGSRA